MEAASTNAELSQPQHGFVKTRAARTCMLWAGGVGVLHSNALRELDDELHSLPLALRPGGIDEVSRSELKGRIDGSMDSSKLKRLESIPAAKALQAHKALPVVGQQHRPGTRASRRYTTTTQYQPKTIP